MRGKGEAGCEGRAMGVVMRHDWQPWSSFAELRTRPVILPPTRYVSLFMPISGKWLPPRLPLLRPREAQVPKTPR